MAMLTLFGWRVTKISSLKTDENKQNADFSKNSLSYEATLSNE